MQVSTQDSKNSVNPKHNKYKDNHTRAQQKLLKIKKKREKFIKIAGVGEGNTLLSKEQQ